MFKSYLQWTNTLSYKFRRKGRKAEFVFSGSTVNFSLKRVIYMPDNLAGSIINSAMQSELFCCAKPSLLDNLGNDGIPMQLFLRH